MILPSQPPQDLSVIVLTGGQGKRMGGACKPVLSVEGKRIIDHILSDLALLGSTWNLRSIVLVGPQLPNIPANLLQSDRKDREEFENATREESTLGKTATTINANSSNAQTNQVDSKTIPIITTREEPVFGGPVAGIVAGFNALQSNALPTNRIAVIPGDSPTAGQAIGFLLEAWQTLNALKDPNFQTSNKRSIARHCQEVEITFSTTRHSDTAQDRPLRATETSHNDGQSAHSLTTDLQPMLIGQTPDGQVQFLHFLTTGEALAACIGEINQSVKRFISPIPHVFVPLPFEFAKDYDTPEDFLA